MKSKDIRTFCYTCFSEYHRAGYKLIKISNEKSTCDKCHRQGVEYLVTGKKNHL